MNASTTASLAPFPPDRIRALTGLTPVALTSLVATAGPAIIAKRQQTRQSQPHRKRRVGGGRKRCLTTEQEILLTVIYLHHNVCLTVLGQLFGVSADTAENTFAEVVAILRDVCPASGLDVHKRYKRNEPSWEPEAVDKIIVQSFETPISPPSATATQGHVYSDTEKRHALTSQIVTDAYGELLVYEASGVVERHPDAVKQEDPGYQGIYGVAVASKAFPFSLGCIRNG